MKSPALKIYIFLYSFAPNCIIFTLGDVVKVLKVTNCIVVQLLIGKKHIELDPLLRRSTVIICT